MTSVYWACTTITGRRRPQTTWSIIPILLGLYDDSTKALWQRRRTCTTTAGWWRRQTTWEWLLSTGPVRRQQVGWDARQPGNHFCLLGLYDDSTVAKTPDNLWVGYDWCLMGLYIRQGQQCGRDARQPVEWWHSTGPVRLRRQQGGGDAGQTGLWLRSTGPVRRQKSAETPENLGYGCFQNFCLFILYGDNWKTVERILC